MRNTLRILADDWDRLAVDGDGWEHGFPDPQFLSVWRRHRTIYRYTLRSELVYQLLQLYRSDPDLTPAYPVDVFLVDEYQDLNLCDLTAIQLLASRTRAEVYAAGDDDQSIYSFRHAHPQGIRDFTNTYLGARVLKLQECHRCGPAIVSISNWLINQELGRLSKRLVSITDWDASVQLVSSRTEQEECNAIARQIAKVIASGIEPSHILVLLRSDKNGRASNGLVTALGKVGIESYRPRSELGSTDQHQILIEYLNLTKAIQADSVDDLAIRSLLKLEDNGIGDKRIQAILTAAWERDLTFTDALSFFRECPTAYTSTGLSTVLSVADNIRERAVGLLQAGGEPFGEWLERVIQTLNLSDEVRDTTGLVIEYLQNTLGDIVDGAGTSDLNYIQEFAATLTEIKDSRPPSINGKITITTMHGGKGLSADIVFVLNAEDEVIPDGLKGIEYDEARRLLYVSLTRARRLLSVHVCKWRDRHEYIEDVRVPNRRTLTQFLRDYGLVARSASDI